MSLYMYEHVLSYFDNVLLYIGGRIRMLRGSRSEPRLSVRSVGIASIYSSPSSRVRVFENVLQFGLLFFRGAHQNAESLSV